MDALAVDIDMAVTLAKLTKGYSFAFQALGYLVWDQLRGEGIDIQMLMPEYDRYLKEFVYDKIYSTLSDLERRFLMCVSDESTTSTDAIKTALGAENNIVSNYKRRLMDKGLLQSPGRGAVSMALPRFREFLKERAIFE